MSLRSRMLATAVPALLLLAPQLNRAHLMVQPEPLRQSTVGAQDAQSPQPSACKGVLSQPEKLKTSLTQVPKYQRTYVLLLAGSAKDKITSPTSPDLVSLPIEINDEPQSVAVVEDLHLMNVRRLAITGQSQSLPLEDLAQGKTEAAIVWGPLAGAGLIDLGLHDKVSVFSVDRPKNPPAEFAGLAASPADSCAAAIADELDSLGVQPAELLVPVSIRALLGTPAPGLSLRDARQGEQVYQQMCAPCHGAYAVADPTLAPVDLLRSIRRFQFVGFKYIVMNGRPQKGMPSLRGTVSEEEISLVFQYLQARSKNELPASSQ